MHVASLKGNYKNKRSQTHDPRDLENRPGYQAASNTFCGPLAVKPKNQHQPLSSGSCHNVIATT